jgi:hypothetical protein
MPPEADFLPFNMEPHALADRRVWVRYRCAPAKPGQTFNTVNYTSQHGRVLNLFGGGMGLLLDLPVPIGTLLKVEIGGWAGNRMFLGRVIHASEQPNGWLHGCELSTPVSNTEIQDLLG